MAVRNPLEAAAARDQLSSLAQPGPEQHEAAQALLGHRFANPTLLTEALTHRSAAHGGRNHRRGERRGRRDRVGHDPRRDGGGRCRGECRGRLAFVGQRHGIGRVGLHELALTGVGEQALHRRDHGVHATL